MTDRTPPLTALRAFDAAARHLSFAAAADELGVTPAALSFQIKSLEQRLGAPLFVRLNRAVALTEAGAALAPGAARGFETLAEAWRAALAALATNRLTLSAGPAFTSKWLAPRLGDFSRAHPEIELRLAATLKLVDFARDDVDIAVRFGRAGNREEGFSEPLMREFVAPFARPDIAARLSRPEDLLNETLVRDDSLRPIDPNATWARWFETLGLAAPPTLGPAFNQADHAIDFALQGGGVVLGRYSVALESVRAGALAAPFDHVLDVDASYRVVCPSGHEKRPAIAVFRAWLREQAARDAAAHQRLGRALPPDAPR